jgi:hypothetical protein
MSVEEFQHELSLQMEELIKQDLINHKINEEKRLLDLKNETEKQEIAKQKQIDEENRLKELAIKTARDNEIKQHVDVAKQQLINLHNGEKQQLINSHNTEKQQIKTNYEQQIQTLKIELQNEKSAHSRTASRIPYIPSFKCSCEKILYGCTTTECKSKNKCFRCRRLLVNSSTSCLEALMNNSTESYCDCTTTECKSTKKCFRCHRLLVNSSISSLEALMNDSKESYCVCK